MSASRFSDFPRIRFHLFPALTALAASAFAQPTWKPALDVQLVRDIEPATGGMAAVGNYHVHTSANGAEWSAQTVANNTSELFSVVMNDTMRVAVGAAGKILSSPDGVTWTSRTSGTTNTLYSVTRGAGVYVAVGAGGIIRASSAGTSWSARTSGLNSDLHGVVHGGGRFVAVGASGAVLTSTNSTTWVGQTSGTTTNTFYAVEYGNNLYAAVGDGGAIYTSPDAAIWTKRTTTLTNAIWRSVAYGGGYFVAVGYDGAVATSFTGTTWTVRNPGVTGILNTVEYVGNQFVAGGENGLILTSPDGANWKMQAAGGSVAWRAATWAGSRYAAVGGNGSIWTSSEGKSWTMRRAATDSALLGVASNGTQTVAVGFGGVIVGSADTVNWTARASGTTSTLQHVSWNGAQFLALGEGGAALTSFDGVTWTSRTTSASATLNQSVWNGSQYVAVGKEGVLLTSPDGVDWTARASGVSTDLTAAAWGNGLFVAVGAEGVIRTSTDGSTWTSRVSGTNQDFNSVTWTGAEFVAVTDWGAMATSSNGTSWTPGTARLNERLSVVTWKGPAAASGAGTFLALSKTGVVLGATPTAVPTAPTLDFPSSAFTFRAGRDTTVALAATGVTRWSITPALPAGLALDPVTGTFHGRAMTASAYRSYTLTASSIGGTVTRGIWVAVATPPSAATDLVPLAHDGVVRVAWTPSPYTGANITYVVTSHPGEKTCSLVVSNVTYNPNCTVTGLTNGTPYRFTVGGSNGVYAAPLSDTSVVAIPGISPWVKVDTMTSGAAWFLNAAAWDGSRWIAAGQEDLRTSTDDGQTWSVHLTPGAGTTDRMQDIHWDGTRWRAVGSSNQFAHSTDGVSWTKENPGSPPIWFNSLAFTGSLWVASTISEGVIVTSTDGFKWTRRTHPAPSAMRDMAWSGSEFVAVGDDGYVIRSTNGLDWTSSQPTTQNLSGVAFANGRWVAVGYSGTVLTSVDGGVTWTRLPPTGQTNYAVAWNGGEWLMAGDQGSFKSKNGVDWKAHGARYMTGLAWGNGKWIGLGTRDISMHVPDTLPPSPTAISYGSSGITLGANAPSDTAFTMTVTGSAVNYGVRPALPPGLYLDPANGKLHGNPFSSWPATDHVFFAENNGDTAFATVRITVVDGPPYSPDSLKAVPWTKAVTLSWKAPLYDGGSPVTGYTVRDSSGNHTCATNGALSCVVTGLNNGQEYGFFVSAKNALGSGRLSTVATATPSKWAIQPTTNFAPNAIGWNGSLYVAVGDSGRVHTSPDGAVWTSRGSLGSPSLRAVAWGDGTWIAVGASTRVQTSPDGITWTARSPGSVGNIMAVAYNGREWVATTSTNRVIVSTDRGVTWTAVGTSSSTSLNGVTWTGSQWIVRGGTNAVRLSSNGTTWTSRTATGTMNALASNDSLTVAVGTNGAIATTKDALTWTTRTSGVTVALTSVTWNGRQWIALGGTSDNTTILTSPNGINWTSEAGPATLINAVIAVPGQWIGVGKQAIVRSIPDTLPAAPAAPAYPSTTLDVGYLGSAVDHAPLSDSTVTQYRISPELPGSLYLDVATGAIKGSPDEAFAMTAFTVTAENGGGAASTALNLRVATPPGKPTNVVAAADTLAANVSWTAPDSIGSSAIAGYTVTAHPGAKACSTDGALSCRVTGLDAETSYRFTVAARNAHIDGPASDTSEAVTPLAGPGAPGAPRNVTASAGATSVTVSWQAPASNGGSAITTYTVTAHPGGNTCVAEGTLSCEITGLTKGTAYRFTVTATSALGTGTSSDTSSSATVSAWTANAQTGFKPRAVAWNGSYYLAVGEAGQVRASTDGVTWTTRNGPSMTMNTVAWGDNQWVVMGETPAVYTSPDGNTWTYRNNGQFLTPRFHGVAWNGRRWVSAGASGSVGGSADGVAWNGSNFSPSIDFHGAAWSGSRWVTVGSGNAILHSLNGTNWTSTPSATTVPTFAVAWGDSLFVAVGQGGAIQTSPDGVTWTARVSPTPASLRAVTWNGREWIAVGDPTTTTTVIASRDGVNWRLQETPAPAVNLTSITAGPGRWVAAGYESLLYSDVDTMPATPVALAYGVDSLRLAPDSSVALAPALDAAVARYRVSPNLPAGMFLDPVTGKIGGAPSTASYPTDYTLTAENSAGTATHALSIGVMSVPGAPRNLAGEAGPGHRAVTLTWDAPLSDGGTPITGYRASAPLYGNYCETTGALTCTITGLVARQEISFVVRATNAKGDGANSSNILVTATAPDTVPNAPTDLFATAGDRRATVTWEFPTFDGGQPITGYKVTSHPDSLTCTAPADSQSCEVTGLRNGTPYLFTATASNALGESQPSDFSTWVTPVGVDTVPGAPLNVAATPGDSSAWVTWQAPTFDGDTAITGYTVTSHPEGKTCSSDSTLFCTVTGLANGTSYRFTVTATNAIGTGPSSDTSAAVIPRTVPGAPRNVAATAGNAYATVSWDLPLSTGGSEITGYTVTSTPQGKTCATTGALTCAVNDLANGTAYRFTVRAANAAGEGAISDTSDAVTPATVPTAPMAVGAISGNGSATVSWSAPVDNGGSAITGYTVTSIPGGKTCTTTGALTCVVSGLDNGVSYRFLVTATTSTGTGDASDTSSAAVPATVPGKPLNVTATGANASATVYWEAPASNGGAAITGYTATAHPGGQTCLAPASGPTCAITGLTNGTAYTFTVTATNTIGTGESSDTSTAVTPATRPGAPTAVVATAGDAKAKVSWTAPASDGGSPVQSYFVTSTPGSKFCFTSGALTCDVEGLENGTAYTFTVKAENALGPGAASDTSNSVTPFKSETVPSAPKGVVAVAGNGSASVSWSAPDSTGGSAITGYTVTSHPGGKTCLGDSTLSCTVNGLTNGTSYRFTVAASNGVGEGPVSDSSEAVIPVTVPGAPTSVLAAAGNSKVTVSWTAPASNGGSAITGYTVTSTPGSKTCTTDALTCDVPGLTNGTAYKFTVVATTAVGNSAASDSSEAVTPVTTPGSPTSVAATSGNGSATVSWSAPDSTGGSAITGYTVTSVPGGKTCTTTGALSCVVNGLENGVSYRFVVTATTSVGSSNASDSSEAVTPVTLPGAPTAVVAVAGNAKAAVSWTAPASNGGSAITGYTVTSVPDGKTCTTTGALTCEVSGLSNGTAYTFTVVATTSVGNSAESDSSEAVTPVTLPGAPTSVVAVAGNAKAAVSWTAPASNGGSAITGYTVTSVPDGKTCTTTGALTCEVSGLTNGTAYIFTVTATTSVGSSNASDSSEAVTPVTLPGAPTAVVAVAGNAKATVSWTAPASNGGSAITGYTVTSAPDSKTCTTTGVLTCDVSGLMNGTAYTFTVVASTAVGNSAASDSSEAVTPVTTPGSPTSVAATSGNGSVTVSWSAPASNGGSVITGYVVTSVPGGKTCSTTGALSCVVNGLENGVSYRFVVTATTSVGSSNASDSSEAVTPVTLPGAPTAVVAVAGNAKASVSWTAPASNGGSAITGYTVTSVPDSKTCTTTGALTCEVSGLSNGTAYTFTVVASTAVGNSAASDASEAVTPVTLPGAPTSVVAVAGNAKATISWAAPASNGGSAITGYTVTSVPDGKTCTTTGALTCEVAGLTNGTAYTFTVVATTAVGSSAASDASEAVTPVTLPGAPTAIVAVAGNAKATVSWTAPASNGGSTITGYTVTSTPGSKTCTTDVLTCDVPGLSNGTAYKFTVVASSAVGNSAASDSSDAVTPVTLPDAPTAVAAAAGNAKATVSWAAPASNGGSAITGYTVTSVPDGKTCTTTGALTCEVTGLTNGTAYTFTVAASTAVGNSAASDASASVTPVTLPGAPTAVVAVAGNAKATVSWTAPASNGGSAITGYTVTSTPGSKTCTTDALTCEVTGLTNGTAYTFTVVASTAVGNSLASDASEAVTPVTLPGAPTSVVAVAGNAKASVSWTAPASNGGSAITGYTVTSVPGSKTCTTTGALTCEVSGLSNGTAYTFTVVASTAVGNSAASDVSEAVTPVTLPGAPTAVAAAAGNAKATVSWAAPASNGGSAITGYTVTSVPGSKTCTTTGALTCEVAGLTNGTAYTFTVLASTAVGNSAASDASASVTPVTLPGAPTAVVAVAGNAKATVSWTAPGSNGGSAITGYIVTSVPGSKTCTTTGALTCEVSGLSNGTAYTFTVVATTTVGNSAASDASASVTPVTLPGAPTSVVAVAGNAKATVSWIAPASNGGSAITGYTVTSVPDGKTCTTTGALTCEVAGLTNGTAYTFTVVATTSVGNSATSDASASVTPVTLPGAPTSVVAVAGNAKATVSWTAPASNGGSAITGYTVTSVPDGKTCTTTGALTCEVTGLTNGTAYTFTVAASTAVGSSAASDASASVTPVTLPGAPTAVAAVAGNAKATVSWAAPGSNGGSAITGYTVTSTPGSKTCTTDALTCEVTGLTNGTAYTFTVVATTAVGNSAASDASASVTPVTLPGAPTSVVAVAGNAKATISWIAPASNGGSAITGYTVTSVPDGKTCTTTGALTCEVAGLTNGTAYTFTVLASTAVGNSAASDASASVTPVTLPGAPTAVVAVAGNAKATISWTAPASNGGSAITGYTVTSTPGSKTCTTDALTCEVTGLTNGTAYTFTVVATTSVGNSAASDASASVTPVTLPGAPTSVVAVAGNAKATVSWAAPASNGGSAITGYTVTSVPDGKACTTTGALTCQVAGLTNGTAYTFMVLASTAVGNSAASDASEAVTPVTLPGAPTSVVAVAGNAKATISWAAPASNGGSAITGYTVTSVPDGKTCTTTGALTCEVAGLTNGTAYTFTVVASTAVGNSAASDASASVTPVTLPGAPTSVVAVAGNAKATVSWTAPASNGGSAITGYTVTSVPDGKTCTTTGALTCEISGLTNGTAYAFTVVATTAVGNSAASDSSLAVTPVTLPGAPTIVSTTPAGGQVTVTWTAPASNGGSAITGYTVTSVPDGKTCATTGALSCTLTGLDKNTGYRFTVTASNGVGTGAASDSSAVVFADLPPSVSYAYTVGLVAGEAVSLAPNSAGGSVTRWTVLGAALPVGLVLDSLTGAISGTPTTPAALAHFAILATGPGGRDTANISWLIQVPAPKNLVYAPDTATFVRGLAVTAWTPTITGTVTRWTVVPALPAGLVLDSLTGVITGTPTTATDMGMYTVTAANGTGSTSRILRITVTEPVALTPQAFAFSVTGEDRPYRFAIPAGVLGVQRVEMQVLSPQGRRLWTASLKPDGKKQELVWNGRTASGQRASAGVYLVRVLVERDGATLEYLRKAPTLRPR